MPGLVWGGAGSPGGRPPGCGHTQLPPYPGCCALSAPHPHICALPAPQSDSRTPPSLPCHSQNPAAPEGPQPSLWLPSSQHGLPPPSTRVLGAPSTCTSHRWSPSPAWLLCISKLLPQLGSPSLGGGVEGDSDPTHVLRSPGKENPGHPNRTQCWAALGSRAMGEVSWSPGPHCTSCCPESASFPVWLCEPSSSRQVCHLPRRPLLRVTGEHWDKLPTPPLGTLGTG